MRRIDRILDATRTVFVSKGYGGTTIDDIAAEAGISRASFYTYFPTKRDALLALGSQAAGAVEELLATFAAFHPRRTLDDIRALVRDYFVFLDRHGAFSIAFTQAASDDDELRVPGMHRTLHGCAELGRILSGPDTKGAAISGLVAHSMMERAWRYAGLFDDQIGREEICDEVAGALHRAYVRGGKSRR